MIHGWSAVVPAIENHCSEHFLWLTHDSHLLVLAIMSDPHVEEEQDANDDKDQEQKAVIVSNTSVNTGV